MIRLRNEISVIPRPALTLAITIALAFSLLILILSEGEPAVARFFMMTLLPALMLVYFLLVAYVYGDSKRRGMRPVMWTLIALFVPNAIGIIAYFIVREPVLHPCPSCGTSARREFAFCPSCGINLPRSCPSCHRPVEPIWSHCAHCGGKLSAASIDSAPPPEAPEAQPPEPLPNDAGGAPGEAGPS